MNTFWNNAKTVNNITETTNGDKSYKSSLNPLVDMMFKAGVITNTSTIQKIFAEAFAYNSMYAVCLLFYIRDIRGGQGRRKFFTDAISFLSNINYELVNELIPYVPEYGYWKDLFTIYSNTNTNVNTRDAIRNYILTVFTKDMVKLKRGENISLLVKWMPSENTSSAVTRALATDFRKSLGVSSKVYRLFLSFGRKHLNIVERNLAGKTFDKIDYSAVPSIAMKNYSEAFFKHDKNRFSAYLTAVENRAAKINSNVLYPFDIVKALGVGNFNIDASPNKSKVLIEQWKALPDFFAGNSDNSIVVADVSGSMSGNPLCASVSLALYIAERNKGLFHNKFITFSCEPELCEISGNNLLTNIIKIYSSNWKNNTNLNSVFELLYKTIIDHPESVKDFPSSIYIISDMQFDNCITNKSKSTFEKWQQKFNDIGVKLPQIIFWNVSKNTNTVPVTINNTGVTLVSGLSPVILKYIMSSNSNNTLQLIEDIVFSDRYKNILCKFSKI